jgi:hypothetical protein
MALLSTMNRDKHIQQLRDYHATKTAEYRAKAAEHSAQIEELDAELATIKKQQGATKHQRRRT